MVERGAELGAIADSFASARAGNGGIVCVEAGTGVGKTRLLEEAAELALRDELRVFVARGRDLERDLPFGVALQLFERELSEADDERRGRLLSGSAALAEPLLVGGLPSSAGLSASLHGLYWLTANIAEEAPLVLLVDDIQWCDRPTLRFLVYLAQRVVDLPVVLVFSMTEAHTLDRDSFVEELRAHSAATLLRPQPLSQSGVTAALRRLVGPRVDPAFAEACFEATGGNPLLMDELALELAQRGVEPRAASVRIVHELAPESIAAAVLVRLRRLSEGTPELARCIAIFGEQVELRHAAALAGITRERAGQLADALMGAGLLRRDTRLTFVHPVVRLAVYTEAPEFERAELHRHAARLLMDEAAPLEQVLPHLLAGRPDGDPRAVRVLMQAGEAALRGGAPQSAIRVLRRALEEPPTPEDRPRVLVALGRAEGAAGAPDAILHLTGALELSGDPASRAAAALDTGRVLIAHGRWDDAAATLAHGIEDIREVDAALLAELEVALATVSRSAKVGDCPESAVDLADETLEQSGTGRLLLARAAADRSLRGTSADEVRELARRAMAGGALLDDETSDGLGFYLALFALVVAEDLQMAELGASTAIDDAQRRGSVLGFATASYLRSLAVVRRGRVSDAAADAGGAIGARRYGWRMGLSAAVSVVAECHLEAGELDHAARLLDQHQQEVEIGTAIPCDFRFFGVLGHVRLLQVAPAAALEDLQRAGGLLRDLGGDNPAVFPWRGIASSAALAVGDRQEAVRLAEEEVAAAASFGAAGAHGRALSTLAAATQGSSALELREQAAVIVQASPAALDRARVLVDFGAALRRAGHRRRAREPLRDALDLASRCGARVIARRAKDELLALGARPRREASTGREALTARESQVAGLAAQGMSNREIAESLFVTVKTVEWHLRHTYEKLGVSSRRELGRVLANREPGEASA